MLLVLTAKTASCVFSDTIRQHIEQQLLVTITIIIIIINLFQPAYLLSQLTLEITPLNVFGTP